MIVYLARAIQAFVMYCVNGTSRSSLLIESTDSMIYTRLSTRLSTSGGYVLCQVYSNSDRQTDTFLNVLTYIIFIFTEYFRMSSGKPFKKIAQPSIPETLFD